MRLTRLTDLQEMEMLDRKIASLPVATNHELSTYLVPNGALAYENVASNLVAGRCLDFLLLFLGWVAFRCPGNGWRRSISHMSQSLLIAKGL